MAFFRRRRRAHNRTNPYARRVWRNKVLDERTISALKWVERKSGTTIVLTQGSYNAGGVAASAGTHDGGGAVDLNISGLSVKRRRALNRWMRKAGFASWYRPYRPGPTGWGPHIHAVLLGHKTASPGAKWQMQAYRNGLNGLADNGPDRAWRPSPIPRWSHRQNKPVV